MYLAARAAAIALNRHLDASHFRAPLDVMWAK
jgi:hypothetical protein